MNKQQQQYTKNAHVVMQIFLQMISTLVQFEKRTLK